MGARKYPATRDSMAGIEEALQELRLGKPVLVFDSEARERETDIVIAAQFATSEAIRTMRKDGGGLICQTMPYEVAQSIGLRYLADIFMDSRLEVFKLLEPNDIPYGDKSAFSATINHRKTFTGISDRDRALTISSFAKLVEKAQSDKGAALSMLREQFRSPGHVFLLIAAEGLLSSRRGHTELSTYLVSKAGLIPSAAIVEMLGDDGASLSKKLAMEYAASNGLVFVEGSDIIAHFNQKP